MPYCISIEYPVRTIRHGRLNAEDLYSKPSWGPHRLRKVTIRWPMGMSTDGGHPCRRGSMDSDKFMDDWTCLRKRQARRRPDPYSIRSATLGRTFWRISGAQSKEWQQCRHGSCTRRYASQLRNRGYQYFISVFDSPVPMARVKPYREIPREPQGLRNFATAWIQVPTLITFHRHSEGASRPKWGYAVHPVCTRGLSKGCDGNTFFA